VPKIESRGAPYGPIWIGRPRGMAPPGHIGYLPAEGVYKRTKAGNLIRAIPRRVDIKRAYRFMKAKKRRGLALAMETR